MRRAARRLTAAMILVAAVAPARLDAWGPQGHRLVARIADAQLTAAARQNVAWLLGRASLADVAVWADRVRDGDNTTSAWHYVNIPPDARAYDRHRDCPQAPGAGARNDRWRDCVIDRILYNQERLSQTTLARADRAVALKFLVHLVADVHQPFHAIGVERGGNNIPISVLGSPICVKDDGATMRCNLHGLWDTILIARRRLSDRRYLASLDPALARLRVTAVLRSTPADWAMESHALARAALLAPGADADDVYFREHAPIVDDQLVKAGLRLAVLLNRSLASVPIR